MRRTFFIHVLLAFTWTGLMGSLNGANLLLGFVLGYLVLLLARPLMGAGTYGWRLWNFGVLVALVLVDLLLSTIRVAVDVIRPSFRMESAVIELPLDLESEAQITLLAGIISLTPGTLTLDLSEDRRSLFIHVMHVPDRDVEAQRVRLKRLLERRIKLILD